ncbi:hypothetical protein O1L55_02815 [Streptomyces albulus]|nr:hypothetical protein [Streptomyces noursei]
MAAIAAGAGPVTGAAPGAEVWADLMLAELAPAQAAAMRLAMGMIGEEAVNSVGGPRFGERVGRLLRYEGRWLASLVWWVARRRVGCRRGRGPCRTRGRRRR